MPLRLNPKGSRVLVKIQFQLGEPDSKPKSESLKPTGAVTSEIRSRVASVGAVVALSALLLVCAFGLMGSYIVCSLECRVEGLGVWVLGWEFAVFGFRFIRGFVVVSLLEGEGGWAFP